MYLFTQALLMVRSPGAYNDNAIVQAVTGILIKSENSTDNALLLKNKCPFVISAVNDRVLFPTDQFRILFDKSTDLADLLQHEVVFLAEK